MTAKTRAKPSLHRDSLSAPLPRGTRTLPGAVVGLRLLKHTAGPLAAISIRKILNLMAKHFFLLSIFLLNSALIISQHIKYLDNKWNQVDRKNASYIETTYFLPNDQKLIVKQNIKNDTLFLYNYLNKDTFIRNGITKIYYPSGKIHYIKNYSNDKLDGTMIRFYEDQKIMSIVIFQKDSIQSAESKDQNGKKIEYIHDRIPPKYNNKPNDEFRRYFMKNLRLPPEALDYKISERCDIKFTVTRTGNIENIEINSIFAPYKEEITRVLMKTNGKWNPGSLYGELIDQEMTFFVSFNL
jgi:hypothetical protein